MVARGVLRLGWTTCIVLGLGCGNRPGDPEFDRQRQEALDLDQSLIAKHGDTPLAQTWGLTVEGQTSDGKRTILDWQEVQPLALDEVVTRSPFHSEGETLFRRRMMDAQVMVKGKDDPVVANQVRAWDSCSSSGLLN